MQLFSTLLEINDNMTPDSFIQLVLKWNRCSPHADNIIPGIEWNGERNIRYGTDQLWMDIEEYRNKNITAIRYEKIAEDSVIWDTDYVMNFEDMKMSINLDRSFLESALTVDPKFSTPYFISILIDEGYLKDDGDLPILRKPTFITESNLSLLADIVNGKSHYRLPVVYVSKTFDGKDPVDIWKLAERLKGVAHVLVQESPNTIYELRNLCDSNNEFNGAIGIYFPNPAVGNRRYLNHQYMNSDIYMAEKVIRSVIQYCNDQKTDLLYTWSGVNNAILRDRMLSKKNELEESRSSLEQNQWETNELLQSADQEIAELQEQIQNLLRENDKLSYELAGLRTKLSKTNAVPLLFHGNEDEFYHGEIKEMLMETLSKELNNLDSGTRRADVIEDLLRSNGGTQGTIKERSKDIKTLLTGYKHLTGQLKKALTDFGFTLSEDGTHCKITYYGDERYKTAIAKTPSDARAGMNDAMRIIKGMF